MQNKEAYCSQCGHLFSDNENFCPNDGSPKSAASSSAIAARIPVLSEEYIGQTVKMTQFDGDRREERRQSFAGPGKSYAESGAFKPYKQNGITAYFVEDKWVFVHLSYWTVEDRFLYLPNYAFNNLKNVTTVTA